MHPRPLPADEIEANRAQAFGLLAALLARPPSKDLLAGIAALQGDATPWGRAVNGLAAAARGADPAELEREFNRLFIGLQRGELVPYASYYLTGFLHDRPLMKLRAEMEQLGVARAEGVGEPEDHIAALLDIMAGLVAGRLGTPPGAAEGFLDRHLAPWAPHFFADLERAENAQFYKAVGTAGGALMEIETDALAYAE